MFSIIVFLVSWSEFRFRPTLVLVLVMKSCRLDCFYAHDSLNRLPSSLFLLFCFCYPFILRSCLHPWKKSLLLSLRILNRKLKHFMNLLFIYKPIKLQHFWDAFSQHNPNQRSHGSTYLTSLMAHVQSFEVLLIKCIWSFDFILISIQLAQPKLDSLVFCCQAWILFGSHFYWNINHPKSMTLKHSLKSSMPLLEI
jgi:hypothetical protein